MKELSMDLRGSSFDIGRKHGEYHRDAIRAFLASPEEQALLRRDTQDAKERIFEQVVRYRQILEEQVPHLAEEVEGLSVGAGISWVDAIVLQYRRELAYSAEAVAGECTLIGLRDRQARAVVAQNIDLIGRMMPLGTVARIRTNESGVPRALTYTFAGLLGFLGMNEAGLAIGINLVHAEDWGEGVSPYLLVRHLLRYQTVAECIGEISRIPRSSSRALTICDAHESVTVEMSVRQFEIQRTPILCQTNHFLSERLAKIDRLHIFSRNASRRRREIAMDKVRAIAVDNLPDDLFTLLADHSMFPLGLCVHAEGHAHREETVASIVMEPQNGLMHVRRGHPCVSKTQTFSI